MGSSMPLRSREDDDNTFGLDPERIDFLERLGEDFISRIIIVEHKDIIPRHLRRSALPTFSSYVIEAAIHRIPTLSRHYLYLNNDMALARPVSFFDLFQPFVVYPSTASPSSSSGGILGDADDDDGEFSLLSPSAAAILSRAADSDRQEESINNPDDAVMVRWDQRVHSAPGLLGPLQPANYRPPSAEQPLQQEGSSLDEVVRKRHPHPLRLTTPEVRWLPAIIGDAFSSSQHCPPGALDRCAIPNDPLMTNHNALLHRAFAWGWGGRSPRITYSHHPHLIDRDVMGRLMEGLDYDRWRRGEGNVNDDSENTADGERGNNLRLRRRRTSANPRAWAAEYPNATSGVNVVANSVRAMLLDASLAANGLRRPASDVFPAFMYNHYSLFVRFGGDGRRLRAALTSTDGLGVLADMLEDSGAPSRRWAVGNRRVGGSPPPRRESSKKVQRRPFYIVVNEMDGTSPRLEKRPHDSGISNDGDQKEVGPEGGAVTPPPMVEVERIVAPILPAFANSAEPPPRIVGGFPQPEDTQSPSLREGAQVALGDGGGSEGLESNEKKNRPLLAIGIGSGNERLGDSLGTAAAFIDAYGRERRTLASYLATTAAALRDRLRSREDPTASSIVGVNGGGEAEEGIRQHASDVAATAEERHSHNSDTVNWPTAGRAIILDELLRVLKQITFDANSANKKLYPIRFLSLSPQSTTGLATPDRHFFAASPSERSSGRAQTAAVATANVATSFVEHERYVRRLFCPNSDTNEGSVGLEDDNSPASMQQIEAGNGGGGSGNRPPPAVTFASFYLDYHVRPTPLQQALRTTEDTGKSEDTLDNADAERQEESNVEKRWGVPVDNINRRRRHRKRSNANDNNGNNDSNNKNNIYAYEEESGSPNTAAVAVHSFPQYLLDARRSKGVRGDYDAWIHMWALRLSTHAFAFSPSIGYYFAMQRSGQAAHQTYNDLIGRRGRVLSLTVNDDLVPVRRGGGGASSIAASTYGLHISPASPLRAAVAGRVGPPFRLQYRGDGADAAKAVLEKRLAVAAVVAAEGLRTTSDGQLRRQMLAFDGAADDEMVESKTRREQLAGGHQDRVAYWRSRRAKHYNLDAFGRRKDFGGRCTNDGEHICAQKQQQITTRNAARN